MARDFSARTDIDNADPTNFPDGRIRDSSSPAANDGTAIVEAVLGDLHQFFLKLLRDASITPNGNADTDSVNQLLDALIAKVRTIAASTTQRGAVELATNLETQTGTDNQRAITPAALSSRNAITTRSGIIRVATNAEVIAGIVSDACLTPNNLGFRVATETNAGIAQIATLAEVNTGTDDNTIVTPDKLNDTPTVVGSDAATKLTYQEFQLGTWDMDTTFSITVNHGIADADNIRNVQVIIINDSGNARLSLEDEGDGGFNIGNTLFTLTRRSTGQFDNSQFSGTQNRGFISFFYRS